MTIPDPYTGSYAGVHAVVVGAGGFIGRWVARYLCHNGAQVSLLVRNRATATEIFRDYQIAGAIYEIDLCDAMQVRRLYTQLRPTITFNLAGYGVDRTERDEATAYQMNQQLVATLCQAIGAVRQPTWQGQDIVHVGSAAEYGDLPDHLPEDANPKPTTLYGQSKLAGTKALAKGCEQFELKGVTARPFTVYGPGEHDGRLLPSLRHAAQTGERVPLTHGRQKRDFVYVEDVAEGLLRLGLAATPPGEVVNLATGVLSTVRCFVEVAAEVLAMPAAQLDFGALPSRPEEMDHLPVTTERLTHWLDWRPSSQLIDGIGKTIAFERMRPHGFVSANKLSHLS